MLCRQSVISYWHENVHLKILKTAVIGPVSNMKIIPSEKIWIPDPEK